MHLHQSPVAALVHRPAGQSAAIRRPGSLSSTPTTTSGASRTSSPSSPACGSQLDTNKKVGGLFPNDADGNAWGDPKVGLPPAFDEAGYKLTDPGRYQNLTDDFSAQITAFKKADAEIVTGVVHAARLHHLLEPGAPAGLQAEGGDGRQGDPLPESRRGARRRRPQPFVRGLVVADHPFKSSLTGQARRRPRRGFHERPSGSGRSRSASSIRCSRSRPMS